MPIKVPIVSKVSDKLNANIVINTKGICDVSLNKDNNPLSPKATQKVSDNCLNDSPNPAEMCIRDSLYI